MPQQITLLELLPKTILGKKIQLLRLTSATWPHVAQLKAHERAFMAKSLDRTENDVACLADKKEFEKLCRRLRYGEFADPFELEIATRFYWVHSPARNHITGYVTVLVPPTSERTCAIGYTTLPNYRNQGLASAAAKTLGSYMLRQGIVTSVCAEVKPLNKKSANVLLRAGFKETARGICSVDYDYGKKVRRFIKAKRPRKNWPIPKLEYI